MNMPGPNQPEVVRASQRPPDQNDSVTVWRRVYTVCRWILRGTQWLGTAVLLVLFISLVANLLVVQSDQAEGTLILSFLGRIQAWQLLIAITLGSLIIIIIIAWLLMLRTPQKDREPSKEEKAKKREEAILKAENDLLAVEQRALETEQRKAMFLEQLLEVEREQITLLKQGQMATARAQLSPEAQVQIIDKFGRTLKEVWPQHLNGSKSP